MRVLQFTPMAGVLLRPALLISPSLGQMVSALLILLPTLGITFSMQAKFSDRASFDYPARLLLAAISLFALLRPSNHVSMLACAPVLLFIAYWLTRRRLPMRNDIVTADEVALAPSHAGPKSAGAGH